MRQIILDTETTGLDPEQGHRVIEIGCVEYINRKPTGETWHQYLNPQRAIEAAAQAVHGLSDEFLADKPLFVDVVDSFLDFVDDAELIIHNAPFDIGFLDAELRRLKKPYALMAVRCSVLDTLLMARERHPGQRNSLDALCKRYEVDNSNRTLHGALLDSQILGEVYLNMTGGQASLSLSADPQSSEGSAQTQRKAIDRSGLKLTVIAATAEELASHEQRLDVLEKASGASSLWRQLSEVT